MDGWAVSALVAFSLSIPSALGAQSAAWRVAPEPVLEIGGSPSDPNQQLYQVVGAHRLDDGRILVANGGTQEVRVYTPDGRWLLSIGGEGEGPGEFAAITRVGLAADSVYVFDRGNQRLSFFDLDGTLRSGRTLKPTEGRALVNDVLRLDDGSWVSVETAPGGGFPQGEMVRRSRYLTWLDEDLHATGTSGELPGSIWAGASVDGRQGFRTVLFTPALLYDKVGVCVVSQTSDHSEVRVRKSQGEIVGSLGLPLSPTEVREGHFDDYFAWIATERDLPEQAIPQIRNVLKEMPLPKTMPLTNQLVVDALGFVWVEEYRPPDGGSGRWRVIDSDGNEVAAHLGLFSLHRSDDSESYLPSCR